MENISQKDLNRISDILDNNAQMDPKEMHQLAKKLKSAEIIPALYVMTYLQAVDKVRKDTQVQDDSSETAKDMMKNNFDNFSEAMDSAYSLELNYLIKTEDQFEGAMWLLFQALNRKNKICDYDDTTLPMEMQAQCSHEDHEGDNPIQKVELVLDYDDDASKWINSAYCYACPECMEIMKENAEGSISCDMESVE